MSAFDEFIADCVDDVVNARTYAPAGDGSFIAHRPCATCGSSLFMDDDGVYCVECEAP